MRIIAQELNNFVVLNVSCSTFQTPAITMVLIHNSILRNGTLHNGTLQNGMLQKVQRYKTVQTQNGS
jgi:hypothetical protein